MFSNEDEGLKKGGVGGVGWVGFFTIINMILSFGGLVKICCLFECKISRKRLNDFSDSQLAGSVEKDASAD